MNITKIDVWVNHDGLDRIHIYTDMPTPFEKAQAKTAILTMVAPVGEGIAYCHKNFPGWVINEVYSPSILERPSY